MSDSSEKPSGESVYDYLVYTLSLPERTIRTTSGVLGGVVRESADLLVPSAFRDSKCYQTLVQQTLDFMIDDIGGVERNADGEDSGKIDNYVARKTVGNFVELASLATLHASPMLLLAVVSDVAYGSHSYLKEFAAELRREGIIDGDSTIDNASDLLEALKHTSGTAATAFDTPPLSVDALRDTIDSTITSAQQLDPTRVLPSPEIERLWSDMQQIAEQEEVSMLEVSGAVTLHALDSIANVGSGALSGVRVAGTLLDRHVVDHYRTALGDIHERGYYETLAQTSGPYVAAVWENYSGGKSTITGDLLSGKLLNTAASTFAEWFGSSDTDKSPTESEEKSTSNEQTTPESIDDSPSQHAPPSTHGDSARGGPPTG